MSDTDLELLARYTRQGAEDAFAELVRRHVALVHSAALRQVRSPQLAQEVAQATFVKLARQAGQFAPNTNLTAWLYQVTRREAIDVVRREARRQLREQIATEMNALNATTSDWTHIEPLLDEAMHALEETDRTAVLLRYFENHSFREVGATLGTSDDAAQKRVRRAVEQLREFLAKRGVAVGASGLALVMSANAVQAAPAGLAATISTAAALAGTTLANTATATATKFLVMTTLQKTFITATLALLAGAGIYQAHRASALRDRIQTSGQEQARLTEQLQQIQSERDAARRQLASLREEGEGGNPNAAELLRLRGEVGRLQKDSAELAQLKTGRSSDPVISEALSWKNRVSLLKQRLESTPGAKIPELQFLTEQDWLNAAKGDLNTDNDYRQALARLRSAGENKFVSELQPALSKYMEANNGQFPTDLTQLQPYFKSPVDPAILQRWGIVPAKSVSSLGMGGDWIITQNTAPDGEMDTRWGVGPFGFGNAGQFTAKPSPVDALTPALKQFLVANSGQPPSDPALLLPYLNTDEQRAELDKITHRFKLMSEAERVKMWQKAQQLIGEQPEPK